MPAEPPAAIRRPSIVAAAAVGNEHLVLGGWFRLPAGPQQMLAEQGDRGYLVAGAVLPEATDMVPGLAVLSLVDTELHPSAVTGVRLDLDHEDLVHRHELPTVSQDLAAVLREGLSAASISDRTNALTFLVAQLAAGDRELPRPHSDALVIARNILRERGPAALVEPGRPPSAEVEVLARVDDRSFYVRGWIGFDGNELERVTLVSPEGQSVDVTPAMFRYSRPDVANFYGRSADAADLGFAALCISTGSSVQCAGWLLDVETMSGEHLEARCPTAVDEPHAVRDLLLADLALERTPGQALRAHHLAPALGRVQERLGAAVRITRVEQFGVAPDDPEISIIVPLYRRIDFVEHQLAQFVHDPEMAAVDLVYVLDSPEHERELVAQCERLARHYRLAFRVAISSSNGGFSIANNLGVSLACGRLLLLMNSDVLPDRPGWLSALVRFHDSRPDPGAVGPKLVYEDESLQHAGMYFDRPAGSRVWFNEHYYKGLHRSFPAANVSRPVPAVSAACLMMRTELYRHMGGLRGIFVQGDHEDSDLCLRLRELGHEIWYAADVELYHLEGQSYPSAERHAMNEFNRWLHTHLWNSRIEALMASTVDDHHHAAHAGPARG